MISRFLKLKLCILISFSLLASMVAQATPAPVATFPIEIIDNRTHIRFDGPDGPVTFLLDTGATSSIFFDTTLIPAAALQGTDEAKISFPAIGKSAIGKRLGDVSLSEGSSTFVSQNGLLITGDGDVKTALEANFSGIIGQELFERYVVEIDPQKETLLLYQPGTDLEENYELKHRLKMLGHTPYIAFKSQLPWEKRSSVKNMLLDSGYPGGMVFWSKKHFMQATSLTERRQLTANQMGVLTAANVSFGNLFFENLPIFIASSVPEQSEERDGLIGASMLAQYRHVVDFHGKRLLLSPLVDEDGDPVQIIDGAVYTPNNEDFKVKFFGPKIPIYPVLTIYSAKSRSRPLSSTRLGGSDSH